MFKWHVIKSLPGTTTGLQFLAYFIVLQIVGADVEAPALQYIAKRLLPDECQTIVNHAVSDPFGISSVPRSYNLPTNGIDCFRKLVGWASNLRTNRRNTHLLLGNRLRQIGRSDLATWLLGPPSSAQETIEYDSWNSKKDTNRKLSSPSIPTVSKISRLVYGPPGMKSIAGMPADPRQHSMSKFPDVKKLNGIHSVDSFKDRYSVMVEPEPVHPVTLAPQYVTVEPSGHQLEHGSLPGANVTLKEIQNNGKETNTSQTSAGGKTLDDGKLKFPPILPHLVDEKTAPCLRVPLGTALAVIGTIMILTCCCALLLRNRLAACFERFRRKKSVPTKRMSTDEEQGFMGPRTVGKPPKRSGRKGGGPIDVANVGVQKSNAASNVSLESDDKPIGCCNCCAKKKKKNRRKWKK